MTNCITFIIYLIRINFNIIFSICKNNIQRFTKRKSHEADAKLNSSVSIELSKIL